MITVLLGPPGAGKGTQAQRLADRLDVPVLSTGDMLRDAVASETEIGKKVAAAMSAGDLVSDDIVIALIESRITEDDCEGGFILDGFPRTVAQAEALDKLLKKHNLALDCVMSFDVSDDEIVRRRAGRLVAPISKRVYHEEFNPPKVAGKCDITGEDLVRREDDKEEVVRHRLSVYHAQTAPVKNYYSGRNILFAVNGAESVDSVTESVMEVVNKLLSNAA